MIYIKAFIFFLCSLVIQIVSALLGLIIVPIALCSSVSSPLEFKTSALGPLNWYPVHLPKWAWLWDNEKDGMRGDHKGRWLNRDAPKWLSNDTLRMFWWAAIRNPANNLKRLVLGCDIRSHRIETLKGNDYVRDDAKSAGFQLVRAKSKYGRTTRYHLYYVRVYKGTNRAIVIELGNKVRVDHIGQVYDDEVKYYKGLTFEVSLFKKI